MLSARRRRIGRRVATRVCPPALGRDPRLLDRVVDHVDATVGSMAPFTRRVLVLALDLHGLGLARRGRLGRSVRDVFVVAYYDQREVRSSLGYEPDAWTAALVDQRANRWGEAIAEHAALVIARLPRPRLES